MSQPICTKCGATGRGVQFLIFSKHGFGTFCDKCEEIVNEAQSKPALYPEPTTHSITDSDTAFDAAIASGLLSADPSAEHYAGHFMYMGTDPIRGHSFKGRVSRAYIYMNEASEPAPCFLNERVIIIPVK